MLAEPFDTALRLDELHQAIGIRGGWGFGNARSNMEMVYQWIYPNDLLDRNFPIGVIFSGLDQAPPDATNRNDFDRAGHCVALSRSCPDGP